MRGPKPRVNSTIGFVKYLEVSPLNAKSFSSVVRGMVQSSVDGSTLWLALEALDTADVHRPGQRRATPALLCRMQLGAAVDGTHPQAIGRGVGARSRRIDRCAAFGAEPVRPLVPAFSGLDVDLRGAALQNKRAGQARHIRTKGGPSEGLTISAMADPDLGWVDFGLEADLTAMATPVDFHRLSPLTVHARISGRDDGQDHSLEGFEQWRTAPRLASNLSERRPLVELVVDIHRPSDSVREQLTERHLDTGCNSD